jgi:GNAT superfamily N-acetyltransferase
MADETNGTDFPEAGKENIQILKGRATMAWTVRRAEPSDAATIIEFNSRLAHETENKKLDPARITPGVHAVLADPNKGVYFVATSPDQQIAGQIMVTCEWSDWRNGWIWWIQSVYVHASARKQGVFRALFEHVAQAAQQAPDVIGLRLYVDHDNVAAQQTYLQLGMSRSNYFVLEKMLA